MVNTYVLLSETVPSTVTNIGGTLADFIVQVHSDQTTEGQTPTDFHPL